MQLGKPRLNRGREQSSLLKLIFLSFWLLVSVTWCLGLLARADVPRSRASVHLQPFFTQLCCFYLLLPSVRCKLRSALRSCWGARFPVCRSPRFVHTNANCSGTNESVLIHPATASSLEGALLSASIAIQDGVSTCACLHACV